MGTIPEGTSLLEAKMGKKKPNKNIDFLDLTILVQNNGMIITKTYQKSMNLHLYLLPHSSYPPKLFKSIIYSTIQKYWLKNIKYGTLRAC